MKVRKSILLLFLFLSYLSVLAQVEENLVMRYNSPGKLYDIATGLIIDSNGNIYVTGWTGTIQYSPNGESLWFTNHEGYDLAVDEANNFYLTSGWFGTIKYSIDGESLHFAFSGYYAGGALSLDSAGNIYVTGSNWDWDYSTIKYSPNGDTLWVRYFNGPRNGEDDALDLKVDKSGNVYVTGVSFDTNYLSSDYITIKYAPNGDLLWVSHYNGGAKGFNVTSTVTLAVDNIGNVYVSGGSSGIGTLFDYTTIKYSPDGDTLWVKTYNGPIDGNDGANALAVDDSSNVYVTGISRGVSTSDDLVTIKYSANGDELWVKRFDGGNGWDGGKDLVLDKQGNIYVTGYSRSLTNEDFITLKYAPNGDILWQMRYNGPVDSNDIANAIAIDDSNNIYVTGRSIGSHTYQDHDYATIKYVQYNCLAKPGDANGDGLVSFSDITTIINLLFKGQPAPALFCGRDTNEDGAVLLSDVVYLINFLFKSGPAPSKNKECCL